MFFTSRLDGSIDIWDYLFKQNDPTLTVQVREFDVGLMSRMLDKSGVSLKVGNSPIHSIKAQEHGRHIATTARDGSTTILELSEGLTRLQKDEKAIFSQARP